MLQAVMTSPGKIEFNNIPVPEIKDGEVLIKIKSIGICGTDLHVYHGRHPYTPYPVVQGHEVSGEISKLGKGVEQFKVGDKVTIQPQVTCGKCYSCTHGNYHICDELKVMVFGEKASIDMGLIQDRELRIIGIDVSGERL